MFPRGAVTTTHHKKTMLPTHCCGSSRVILFLAASSALLAPAGRAQSVNIDLNTWGAAHLPASTYGAAAGQAGHWNNLNYQGILPLNGLDGAPSGVSVETSLILFMLGFDHPGTSGDDEKLIDDFWDVNPAPGMLSFTGLEPGTYDVFTYAIAPDGDTWLTDIEVLGSSDPVQVVGGAWPGGHALGTTYALHSVVVDSSGTLAIVATVNTGFASVNGVQLVQRSTGTTFCTSNPNSTGATAELTAAGTLDALLLRAAPVPVQPALFYYGSAPSQVVFGNGIRCVGGSTVRLNPPLIGIGNEVQATFDLSTTGLGTIYLQCWYRDPAGAAPGFNLSNGLSIP